MPATESLRIGGLPLGLAQNVKLKTAKRVGEPVCWSDVEIDHDNAAVRIRREMETMFSSKTKSQAA
jgi:predicted homoserine dehydrogenase-like protein